MAQETKIPLKEITFLKVCEQQKYLPYISLQKLINGIKIQCQTTSLKK